MATKQREVKQWITVNGVHVPVFEGESKADAVKKVTGQDVPERLRKLREERNKAESEMLNPHKEAAKNESKQTEEQKIISKNEDEKEKQIADNKKQAENSEKQNGRPFESYSTDQLQKTYSQYMQAGNAEGANAITKELAERNKQSSGDVNKQLDNIGKQIRASHNRDEIHKLERERDKLVQERGRKVQKSRIDSMYSQYSQRFSVDPNNWLQYGQEGKDAYYRYKEAVEQYEPDRIKRAKYFKDRRKF